MKIGLHEITLASIDGCLQESAASGLTSPRGRRRHRAYFDHSLLAIFGRLEAVAPKANFLLSGDHEGTFIVPGLRTASP